MILKNIILNNFRNIKNAQLEFCDGINIIYGDNAQGKTNILEAIWYLSVAKGFRSKSDAELIKFDEQCCEISSQFVSCGRKNNARVCLDKIKKKKVFLNSVLLNPSSRLIGNLKCILFTPDDLTFITDGPAKRRKFMDISLCQQSFKYINVLMTYNRLLKQRNALLKETDINNINHDLFDIYDCELAKKGAFISYERNKFIKILSEKSEKIHSELSENKENLCCIYKNNVLENYETKDFQKIYAERFYHLLKKNLVQDVISKSTKFGIHKDDIEIKINDLSVRNFGSQGQKKSAVLSLKIAQSELLSDEYGEYPVILLDDIISELDKSRQDFILNKIKGKQVIITLCDENNIQRLNSGFEQVKIFNVKNGCIV